MKLSINEILKLKVAYNDGNGIDYELTELITGGIGAGDYFTSDRIKINDYMLNYSSDCRSRSVNIIFFDDIPTVFYQYVGKGEYENVFCINKEKMTELKMLMINQYIAKESSELDILPMDSGIEIKTYGATCSKEGNQLTARCL